MVSASSAAVSLPRTFLPRSYMLLRTTAHFDGFFLAAAAAAADFFKSTGGFAVELLAPKLGVGATDLDAPPQVSRTLTANSTHLEGM